MRAWSESAGVGVINLQFTPDWPVRCVFKLIEMLFSKKPNMKQICAVCGQAVCPYSSGNDRTSRRMDAFSQLFFVLYLTDQDARGLGGRRSGAQPRLFHRG